MKTSQNNTYQGKFNKTYDGRWKVVKCTGNKYILENIYNGRQIKVSNSCMQNIHNGKTTISNIITMRLHNEEPNQFNKTPKAVMKRNLGAIKRIQGERK